MKRQVSNTRAIELRKGQRCMLAFKNIIKIRIAEGESRKGVDAALLSEFPITYREFLFHEQSGRTRNIMKGIDY